MLFNSNKTQEENEAAYQKLLNKLKQKDPLFDARVEFGRFLLRHIDDLTPEERKRYDELQEFLLNSDKNVQVSDTTESDSSTNS